MRAVTLDSPDTAPALRADLPAPTPADSEVLVRVHASSVNPVDNSIAAGMLAHIGVEYDYPVTLGRDYAGVVEQTGAAVTGYQPDDRVFGFLLHANPKAHDGAWTELITVTDDLSIAPLPEGVDVAVAGAAPLAGITAMMAVDALALSEGEVVLVAGATGGVGSLASNSPLAPGPVRSRRRCPRTRPSCATSASPRCSRATATSRRSCASWYPTASTRCSTSSTTRLAPTTLRSRLTRVSPHPPARPAKAQAAPW